MKDIDLGGIVPARSSEGDRNCISYWLPKLVAAGLPVPMTVFVRTDVRLAHLLNGKEPDGFDDFLRLMKDGCDLLDASGADAPFFLRTGQGSGKHDWSETCHLPDRDALPSHIHALVEWSECAGFVGLPYDVWAVREMLPVAPLAHLGLYGGMPLVPEVRCFVRDGKVVCAHPYWPLDAIRDGLACGHAISHKDGIWGRREPCAACADEARRLFGACQSALDAGEREWRPLAEAAAVAFAGDGGWSVDLLPTDRGWFVTDMAVAEQSYHWPDCPLDPGRAKGGSW